MRFLPVALSLAAYLLAAGPAVAEKRVFIIANQPDGYGVDRCLATQGSCGAAIANTYCRSRDFEQALSYRKIDPDDVAGTVSVSASCQGSSCMAFVAIECAR